MKVRQADPRIPTALRWAYEQGRARAALPWLGVVLALTAATYFLGQRALPLLCGVGLAFLIFSMRWAGRAWGHVAELGVGLGAIPYLAACLASSVGSTCALGGCSSWCLPLCAGAGLLAGALASRAIVRRGLGFGYALLSLSVIVAVGALACRCLGASSLVGTALGVAAGAASGWPRLRRAS